MNNGKEYSHQVRDFYQIAKQVLKLRTLLRTTGFSRVIKLDGSRESFLCFQVWGKRDNRKLSQLPPAEKSGFLEKIKRPDIASFVITDGVQTPSEILKWARKERIAIFHTPLPKSECQEEMRKIFSNLSMEAVIPGGLLKVFDLGVLIIGDSGIGKSESSLELISRGHLFISDDVTQVMRMRDNKITGKAPSLSQDFMEIRGLSIINIKEIFGSKAVCKQGQIHLVINLQKWEYGKKYDRLGLETPGEYEILRVKIPKISIPVAPGRNIATLIEVACKVHILREKGYHAPEEITKKLDRALSLK